MSEQTQDAKTDAEKMADLGYHGDETEAVHAACVAAGATISYARTRFTEDGFEVEETWSGGDPNAVRYEMPDGSAIVVDGGAAWDVEGEEPFSWESDYT